MAKQEKKEEKVNWNSKQLTVGDKFTVEYEITELQSDGTAMTVGAKPVNLPAGVSHGNISLGVIPQDNLNQ